MALRVAVATGNWSNPAIWNGGVLPSAGDIVASNGFTVTIDQNINVDSLTNAVASVATAIPVMTSNTSPSGIASASNITSGTYDAFKAFDANSGTWWGAGTVGAGNPKWVSYEFSTAKAIDKYYIQGVNNGAEQGPKDWEFQGWNGTSWITLHTVTGNTTTYTSPLIGNSTAYIKYRLYVTLGQNTNLGIINLEMYEYLGTTAAVAGGGFVLNGGVTVTLTNTTAGIIAGPTNCVTYSAASGTSTINGIIRGSSTNGSVYGINYTGAANLNINGALTSGPTGNTNAYPIFKSGTGTLTIVGNLTANVGTNAGIVLYNSGTGTINITGNIYATNDSGYGHGIQNTANCILNITGSVYGGNINNGGSIGIYNQSISTINIVGNVYGSALNQGIYTNSAGNLNITGSLIAGSGYAAVYSGSSTAINLFTGPFISSPYGTFPYQCIRMHLIPSASAYLEFRDETTNGAVSPGAIAPATRMVAPASIVDAPAPANVRFGTIYANGTQTGTCKIPATTAVAAGVGVDNTVGSAVLSPGDVWNALISTMTTSGSIGERLKNASTVQTTGEQLASIN